MRVMPLLPLSLAALLGGCASLFPPSPERLAALPVVVYPDKPVAGQEFVYKLAANRPVAVRVRADGSALTAPVEQTVSASLGRDLYLYGDWASEDGQRWVRADQLVGVRLSVVLPSHEYPGPGDIHLSVDRLTP